MHTAITKGRLDGDAHDLVTPLHDLAEARGVHLLGFYLPRDLNGVADALSKARDAGEATAVATRHGLSLEVLHEGY